MQCSSGKICVDLPSTSGQLLQHVGAPGRLPQLGNTWRQPNPRGGQGDANIRLSTVCGVEQPSMGMGIVKSHAVLLSSYQWVEGAEVMQASAGAATARHTQRNIISLTLSRQCWTLAWAQLGERIQMCILVLVNCTSVHPRL